MLCETLPHSAFEAFLTELQEPGASDHLPDPIRDFDYKTPEILVSEGKSDAVIHYIESLSSGASG